MTSDGFAEASGPSSAAGPTASEIAPSAPAASSLNWIRVSAKVLLIMGWTAALAGVLAVAWTPTLVAGRTGTRWRAAIRQRVFRVWGRVMLRIVGVRVETLGDPPPAGSLIVSNHLSYLDIIVLASLLPAVFVSKAEVRKWPFWGLMAAMAGTVFIDRSIKRDTVRVLGQMDRAFARGDSVIVFPEATSTEGATILPFKSSLLATAAQQGNLVHWLTVTYQTPHDAPSARERVCWWGDMEFLSHFLGLCDLRRIDARVTYGPTPEAGEDRKELASNLRRAMLPHFEPVS